MNICKRTYDEVEENFVDQKKKLIKIRIERTLAIFKNRAYEMEIPLIDVLLRNGITVTNKRYIHLSFEQAMSFYDNIKDSESREKLANELSCGPAIAMVLVKRGVLDIWKNIVAYPKGHFDENSTAEEFWAAYNYPDWRSNDFHASITKSDAASEIRFFFPEVVIEPILTGQKAKDYLNQYVIPTLLNGLTEVCRKKPRDPVVFLSEWLLQHNPYQPSITRG